MGYIHVQNNLNEGYIPLIPLQPGLYAGKAIVKNRNGKAYLPFFNTSEEEHLIEIPTLNLEEFDELPKNLENSSDESEENDSLKPINLDQEIEHNLKSTCESNKDTRNDHENNEGPSYPSELILSFKSQMFATRKGKQLVTAPNSFERNTSQNNLKNHDKIYQNTANQIISPDLNPSTIETQERGTVEIIRLYQLVKHISNNWELTPFSRERILTTALSVRNYLRESSKRNNTELSGKIVRIITFFTQIIHDNGYNSDYGNLIVNKLQKYTEELILFMNHDARESSDEEYLLEEGKLPYLYKKLIDTKGVIKHFQHNGIGDIDEFNTLLKLLT